MRPVWLAHLLFLLIPAFGGRLVAAPMESVDEAVCRLIEAGARAQRLAVGLFARLI